MAYQGWTNWETWNVALWAGNDEPIYREVRSLRPYTAQKAQLVAQRLYPNGTPDMRGGGRPRGFVDYMKTVNWQEIADAWNEE